MRIYSLFSKEGFFFNDIINGSKLSNTPAQLCLKRTNNFNNDKRELLGAR